MAEQPGLPSEGKSQLPPQPPAMEQGQADDFQDSPQNDEAMEDVIIDDEDEEEEEQDEEELYEQIRNMMENPVIQPIQQALKKQLMEADLRVSAELRDKQAELKEAKELREQTGVELYGVQQQLARMQMNLEKTYDNFKVVSAVRGQTEQDTRVLQDQV